MPGEVKLTRKLVLARAKASDLESVKKLNCWGCNLTDISIFSEMPNIEVLTLSANKISSLEHISSCQNLTELYLRRNDIQNLSELCHLKHLARLRVLWLAENPCCDADPTKYRLTILRNLTGLHKLDNEVVTEEELAQALEDGEEIGTPPGPPSAESTNGMTEADSENDPLNFSMMETKESGATPRKRSHALEAVLLLLKDLNSEELKIVQGATEHKLRSRSRHKEKSLLVQT
ncbi:cilia and flagella associated protein 410 isoform X2 [Clupea harengus]|uniref:Cilia- and flagella-associated protein 410 n=1 Tax=Clupea harengus TaxID=7950 RepID=A0A6P8EQA7_CLUHA|nr:cilia and flagella associated protein 410 isoform X2 [Clupea harengus]